MMLSIVLVTLLIAALVVSPATIEVFLRFGAIRERFYNEIIWYPVLKQFRKG